MGGVRVKAEICVDISAPLAPHTELIYAENIDRRPMHTLGSRLKLWLFASRCIRAKRA